VKSLAKRAQLLKDDEYYTTKEHVKRIFEYYLKDVDFSGKTIYCFCDSEYSEFVKYLKDNWLRLNYKKILYTSDDFNNHMDLFEECDYIITNPPFSKVITQIIPILKKYNKKYFLLCSKYSLYSIYNKLYTDPDFKLLNSCGNKIEVEYDQPKENVKKLIPTIYITNIKEVRGSNHKVLELTKEYISDCKSNEWIEVNDEKYLHIRKLKDIPYNYDDWMMVPITVLFDYNIQLFDIDIVKSINNKPICQKYDIYIRILVKRKKKN
jgi:hypothetical protein